MERTILEKAIEKVLNIHHVTVAADLPRFQWTCSCGATTVAYSIEGVKKMNRLHLANILAAELV